MMQKMGWSEGRGLGREEQGMTTPLVAHKTDRVAGTIAPGAEARRSAPTPTCVVCLRGMVGPGEVDEALEDEVAEECEKHGPVVCVLIFEVTEPGCAPEDAVRIFVQFTRADSAAKARTEMDGRFFGGRTVRASFFSEARFEAQQLAPQPGEFDA
jgi:splicing factor 45